MLLLILCTIKRIWRFLKKIQL